MNFMPWNRMKSRIRSTVKAQLGIELRGLWSMVCFVRHRLTSDDKKSDTQSLTLTVLVLRYRMTSSRGPSENGHAVCMTFLSVSTTISKSLLPSSSVRSPVSQLDTASRAAPPFPGDIYRLRVSLMVLISFKELLGSYKAEPSRARKSTTLRGTTCTFVCPSQKEALSTSYHCTPPPSSVEDIQALMPRAKLTWRRIISSYPLRPREYKALNKGRPRNRREFSMPIFKGDGMLVIVGGKSRSGKAAR